jgi:hypothetical protein
MTLVGLSVREESVTAPAGVMVSVACRELDPAVAVITADEVVVTVCVLTVNDALVEPAGTVTLDGTVAAEALLLSETAVPPAGAAVLSVTVPWDVPPPCTLAGFSVNDETVMGGVVGGVIVSVACTDPLFVPAETIAVVVAVTDCVVMGTVAVVLPAGMMMLGVTDAAGLLLVNVTAVPPEGAGPFSVTVACEVLPPVTLAGLRVNEAMAMAACGGAIVSVACCELPPAVTVITTLVFDVTGCVLMAKEVVVLPAVMDTPGGILARPLLLEMVTTTSPVGAGPVRFTVPWELNPPVTLDALPFGTDNPG